MTALNTALSLFVELRFISEFHSETEGETRRFVWGDYHLMESETRNLSKLDLKCSTVMDKREGC